MDYGPVQPLSDPEEHAKLVELLKGGGLVPVDVDMWPHTRCEPIQLEVNPPTDDWYSVEGISSTMESGVMMLLGIEIQQRRVLQDIDPGSFNLGHLVPMPLGCFSRTDPLVIYSEVVVTEGNPALRLTFWCRVSASSCYPGAIGMTFRQAPPTALLKALRLLKANDVDVDDDELRAILDHYAPIL